MAKEIMLWDKEKTRSTKASKIREFMIAPARGKSIDDVEKDVYGWYNPNEDFYFGRFGTEEEARAFVEDLHRQMKGG